MISLPKFSFIIILLITLKVTWCAPQSSIEEKVEGDLKPEHILNVCLDSPRHKKSPGPEKDLIDECKQWNENACCTADTVKKAHSFRLYNFTYDMCSEQNMSEACKKFFIRDTCFYECSPNVGPWKTKVNETNRKETFRNVPLCKSECDQWFEACAYDYTCNDNWSTTYNTATEDGNICKKNPVLECITIKEMFQNSTNFCERIWDFSWKVVDDSQPCMKTSFDRIGENPNDIVAKKFALQKYGSNVETNDENSSTLGTLSNTFLLIATSIISLYSFES